MTRNAALFFVVAIARQSVAVSPVQKVVQLLTNLEAKIVKDGKAEDVAYAAFAEWCRTGAKDKEFEIKTAKSEIEDLSATINKADADITEQTAKVQDMGSAISTNDADLKAATQIRDKEGSDYTAAETELKDVVDTLERAINVLQRKMRGSNLLQEKVNMRDIRQIVRVLSTVVDAASLSLSDKNKLIGLVQSANDDDEEDDDFGAPAPNAYQSKSGSIIDVLEDLKQKAVLELQEARKQEINARHNFDMLKQSLTDQIKVDSKELDEAKLTIHEATETKAGAEGALEATKKDLNDAQSVLKNMDGDCKARASDHDATLKNRAEELEAIRGALEAVKSMGAGGQGVVYGGASFLQIDGAHGDKLETRVDLANFEVVNLLRRLAKEQESPTLAQMASQISTVMRAGTVSGEDPFGKVRDMISAMLERLLKEGGEEAKHKEYCDKEMAETTQKTDELKYDLDKYSSKLDKAKADSVMLKDEVATLSGEIAEIARSQSAADGVRKEEHSVYVTSKSDLEQGLSGVRTALKVLREYYQSKGSSFSQQPAAPELHEKASGAGTSIIGMLEVVEADFGKSLAATEMNEETAAVAYQKISMENRVSKSLKESDVKYQTKQAAALDKSALELRSDLDSAQTELDAVLDYSKNIRGMCELKPESYEQRKGRREAEIAGLKEALKILEGETVGLLQKRGRAGFLQFHLG